MSSKPALVLIFAALIGSTINGELRTAAAPPPPAASPASTGSSAESGQSADEAKQQKIKDLLSKADQEQDLKKKIAIYDEILHKSDSTNQAAYDRRKDAQAKLDALKQEEEDRKKYELQRQANAQQKQGFLDEARKTFVIGDLAAAGTAVSQAKKLAAPDDPEVKHLEGRVQQATAVQQRIQYIWAGSAGAALLGLLALVFTKRGKKEPYIEVVDGANKGRRYALPRDQEVVMIGAVDEYGGVRNDIVLADPDRNISRFHCRILRVGRKLYLLDKDSANGTWVDRKRVHHGTAVRLRKGARISLAEVCVLRLGFERKQS